jgi:hypothetical protein
MFPFPSDEWVWEYLEDRLVSIAIAKYVRESLLLA